MWFFFNDTATTEIYTLSLHDALPICAAPSSNGSASLPRFPANEVWARSTSRRARSASPTGPSSAVTSSDDASSSRPAWSRSEEHTSELQSRQYLGCRLLLEKKTCSRA